VSGPENTSKRDPLIHQVGMLVDPSAYKAAFYDRDAFMRLADGV